jgi:hypothetical protein
MPSQNEKTYSHQQSDRGQFIGKIGIRDEEQGIWLERYTGPMAKPFNTCTLFLERNDGEIFPLRLNNELCQFLLGKGEYDYEYVSRRTGNKLMGFVEKPGVLTVRGSRGQIDQFVITEDEVSEILNNMSDLNEKAETRVKKMVAKAKAEEKAAAKKAVTTPIAPAVDGTVNNTAPVPAPETAPQTTA